MKQQQIYDNKFERKNGMDYRPGIHFEKSLVGIDKKSLTTNNKMEQDNGEKKGRYISTKHLHINFNGFPTRIFM